MRSQECARTSVYVYGPTTTMSVTFPFISTVMIFRPNRLPLLLYLRNLALGVEWGDVGLAPG